MVDAICYISFVTESIPSENGVHRVHRSRLVWLLIVQMSCNVWKNGDGEEEDGEEEEAGKRDKDPPFLPLSID